jgi:hypothetical protein
MFVRPSVRFVKMAAVAGIGGTELYAKVGTWNAKAVVWSVIYSHVVTARHVALYTFGSGADVKQHPAIN